MEQPQKKRMSKGCMVTLIIVLVILVMVIAAAITCWMKKDDLAKYAAQTVIQSVKTQVAEGTAEGIDSVQVNAVTDAFIIKLSESELDYEKYQVFFQKIQPLSTDDQVDAAEVAVMMDAMIEYFPELEKLITPPVEADSLLEEAMPEAGQE